MSETGKSKENQRVWVRHALTESQRDNLFFYFQDLYVSPKDALSNP